MQTCKHLAIVAAIALALVLPAQAQGAAYSADQLDQLVAPIALYPDSLLMQILMASTYPQEVVEADRWCKDNAGLSGADRENALAGAPWDPSVTSLTAFPDILARLASNLDWTEALGEAFIAQQSDVLAAVQTMRWLAYNNHCLQSSPDMSVVVNGGYIALDDPNANLYYMPYYDPLVVYGPRWRYRHWLWPGVMVAMPGWPAGRGVAFSVGVGVGGLMFGGVDWHRRSAWVNRNYWTWPGYRGGLRVHNAYGRPAGNAHVAWRFDNAHRGGVNFHNATLQQKYHPQARATTRTLKGYGAPAAGTRPATRPAATRAVTRSTVRPTGNTARSSTPYRASTFHAATTSPPARRPSIAAPARVAPTTPARTSMPVFNGYGNRQIQTRASIRGASSTGTPGFRAAPTAPARPVFRPSAPAPRPAPPARSAPARPASGGRHR